MTSLNIGSTRITGAVLIAIREAKLAALVPDQFLELVEQRGVLLRDDVDKVRQHRPRPVAFPEKARKKAGGDRRLHLLPGVRRVVDESAPLPGARHEAFLE